MTPVAATKPTRITVQKFLEFVRQSELLEPADCDAIDQEFPREHVAGTTETPRTVAGELISRGMLTAWQADKLLQGKHRSFHLGKYRLLGLVGKGGMSTVYLAEHRVMRRRCAVKVLPSKRVDDTSWLARFRREAQVGASLDHPNIIRTFDIDFVMDGENEVHFIVMEYVDGDDLKRIVLRDGPFDQEAAADFIRQAADGLSHAHKAGLVHRDIKPANLLLEADGTIRLMDLGLVTGIDDEDESLTRAHNEKVIGTADYLSPEQALDSHLVDPRADLYGLGYTLYFLLTGRPPFHEGSLASRILAHQTREPEPLSELVPGMSSELSAIVRKMTRKKADDRYQTAAEVSMALAHWLADHGSDEWREEHRSVLKMLPEIPDSVFVQVTTKQDEPEHIPVAKPVIPDYESPYTPPTERSTSVIDEDPVDPRLAASISELKVDDSVTLSDRGQMQDRWLFVAAVSMLLALCSLAAFVVWRGFS